MSDVTPPPRFFLLLHVQGKVELQCVERSVGSDGCVHHHLAVSDPTPDPGTCAQCQVLGVEVARLLAVVDQKERELSTVCLERPLTVTLQRANARIVDLESALGDAIRVWSQKVRPEDMILSERAEYERLIEVYHADRLAMLKAAEEK